MIGSSKASWDTSNTLSSGDMRIIFIFSLLGFFQLREINVCKFFVLNVELICSILWGLRQSSTYAPHLEVIPLPVVQAQVVHDPEVPVPVPPCPMGFQSGYWEKSLFKDK